MPTTQRDTAAIIARYEADLMSGKVFHNHAASAASRFGYASGLPGRTESYADAVTVLAKAASLGQGHALIVRRILRELMPNASDKQNASRLWTAVLEGTDAGWFDTINAASPEPGRRSDNEKSFGLRDRLTVMLWASAAAASFDRGSHSIGWCLAALLDRELAAGMPYWVTAPFRPTA